MPNKLSINRLVKATLNLAPTAAQMQNINTLLILGSTDVIDVHERYRAYTSIDAVATDFGTTAPEYLAAVLWFEQAPQPSTLQIGRWAQTATAGKLACAPLTTTEQLIATWQAITNGSFDVAVDGAAAQSVSALDFSGDTTLNGVASTINTALAGAATCVWNSTYSRFEFTSATTGATSSISFLTAGGVGTDISGMLKGLSTDSGAYVADGIAAETPLDAITLFDNNFGQNWYAAMFCGITQDSDHVAVAGYIEASANKHIYGVTTQETGVLISTDTTNVAYQLQQLSYDRSVVQYSGSNAYAVASLLGRALTVDYTANSSVITLMYKQEPGIVAEYLTETQAEALEGFNCNVFAAYNNDTSIVQPGKMVSGEFIDVITGTDWLLLDLQTTVYNLLYSNTTKIPQTDAGNHIIATAMEGVLAQAVDNGLLAPGVWESGGFGALSQGDFLKKGFYIYAPPVGQQSAANRQARKSVAFQIAAKLAGAIHTIDFQVDVNR